MTLKVAPGWLTRQLILVATRIAPRAREEWTRAMSREVDAMHGQRDALRWALGCLQVSCHERLKSMMLTNMWPVRWGMALWVALLATDAFAYAATTLAYKLGIYPLTEHWNVPLLEATPLWEPMLTLAAGVVFLLAIVLILRRRRTALEAVVAPFAILLLLFAVRFSRPESGYLQSLSIAYERSYLFLIWPVAGLALTVLICLVLWHDKRTLEPR